jgi:hypothetical protein
VLWKTSIRTSTRKFDALGHWYLVKRPSLIRAILRGDDQSVADLYYYDFKH